MISFTTALILFTVMLTGAYLGFLLAGGRSEAFAVRRNRSISSALSISAFALSLIGVVLTLSTDFRETPPYFAIITLVPVLAIMSRAFGGYRLDLTSIILWHIMMCFSKMPYIDVSIGEGSQMVREMRFNDHWDFKWAHNPSYNPIPTMAFIQATLSRIIGVSWCSYVLGAAIFFARAIAYDLAIYCLTHTLTNNSLASLTSIVLIAITPETALHQHPYQWSGNMLTLLALILIVKAFKKRIEFWKTTIILITTLFTGSILSHPTGLSLLILSTFSLLSKEIVSTLRKFNLEIERNMSELPVIIPSILLAIFLFRAMYTYGYAGYVLPNLIAVYNGLIDFLKEFFIPGEKELGEAYHIPLYERAGISPMQAYAWSFVIAVATANMVYGLLKKRVEETKTLLYIATISIIFISFTGYAVIRLREFYVLNRTTYVFIPYIIPLAAEAIATTITKRSKVIALISLILLAISAPIASQDPNISPIQYAKARASETVELHLEDLLMAKIIMHNIDVDMHQLYHLYIKSDEIFRTGRYRLVMNGSAVGIWYPVYTSRLESALNLYSFINSLPSIDVTTQIGENDIQNLNLIFSTGNNEVYLSYS